MAFITLRRSRNTRSYYLVESFRDERGRSCKRTLCYLGRQQDGTDTLEKALAHWQALAKNARSELRSAPAARRQVVEARVAKAELRIALLRRHDDAAAIAEARRSEQSRQRELEEEARRRRNEEAEHWQVIERLYRSPSADNAQAAKRAFRTLALRLHPDQGGRHEDFVRLKQVYDRAFSAWGRRAG